MKGFAEPRYLMTSNELKSHLSEVTLIDVRPGEDYANGHIETALHFDFYGISLNDTSESPMNAFLWMVENLFGFRGVTRDQTVVFYDHESGERAARGVWLLDVFNHPDAKLLDGGLQAWEAAGHPLTTQAKNVDRVSFEGNPRRTDRLATRFDMHKAIDNKEIILLDTRREAEYIGTERRARRVGTMPGSVHIFWREHLDKNGAYKNANEIRELYQSKGVTPDKSIYPYCQGGYRSANTYLALKMLGYPNVKNYLGSWWEWGNRDDSIITPPPVDYIK